VTHFYYLYISDAKVDMLIQQIDPTIMSKRTSELAVNLRIFAAKRGKEVPNGAARTARVERVVRHLLDHGDMGSVDAPGQYFYGILPVQWGPLLGSDGLSLVYFGGRTEKTILGLGGSRAHLIGAAATPSDRDPLVARSHLPSLLSGISKASHLDVLADSRGNADLDDADRSALEAVRRASSELRGPAQNVEFVAKTLLRGSTSQPARQTILLGSPLYVALVD
jgi:hypothetical protein